MISRLWTIIFFPWLRPITGCAMLITGCATKDVSERPGDYELLESSSALILSCSLTSGSRALKHSSMRFLAALASWDSAAMEGGDAIRESGFGERPARCRKRRKKRTRSPTRGDLDQED